MTVLVIAPHPDDEILGCGGVIAKRAEAGDDVWVCIVSEGKRPMYSRKFIEQEFKEMQIAHSNVGVGHQNCNADSKARHHSSIQAE